MIWLVGFIALILMIIGWEVFAGLANLRAAVLDAAHADRAARADQFRQTIEKLEAIEAHVGRCAEPFYQADRDDARRKREDPESYYWERKSEF